MFSKAGGDNGSVYIREWKDSRFLKNAKTEFLNKHVCLALEVLIKASKLFKSR